MFVHEVEKSHTFLKVVEFEDFFEKLGRSLRVAIVASLLDVELEVAVLRVWDLSVLLEFISRRAWNVRTNISKSTFRRAGRRESGPDD